MRVGISIQDDFPTDRQVRAKRIARALEKEGSETIVFARNTGQDPARGQIESGPRPTQERLSYALVRRFSWLASTPLFGLVTAPLPLNPIWSLWLLLQLRRYDIDVVVAGDIRAGIPTAVAAKLLGIPVVLDVREHYVGLAASLPAKTPLDRVLQHETLVGALERATIALADHVWVVVEERREELIARGTPGEKVSVVSNTPELSEETDTAEELRDPEEAGFDWKQFTLVYVGVLNRFRGLDLILDALYHLNQEGDSSVNFAVAGEGPHRDALERRAAELGIKDQVTFLGWIDAERVPVFLRSGSAGVIPHEVTALTNHTIPNKLFDYMLAELPVLATDMAPVQRIVTDENCGYVLPPDTTGSDAAAAIQRLKTGDTSMLAANGRRAVEERYNWKRDAKQVRKTLERLQRGTEDEARLETSSLKVDA